MQHHGWSTPRKYKDDDRSLANQFAEQLKVEAKELVKEVVFFGSAARSDTVFDELYEHDIDVLVIFDDGVFMLSPELTESYRVIATNVARNVSGRLHINTLRLSSCWEYAQHGDPIIVNILRDGIPLIGAGIFESMRILLGQGLITPSNECILAYFNRAPQTLLSARGHILEATMDLYWAVLDAAHAALMSFNLVPLTPEVAFHLIGQELVKKGKISKTHLQTVIDLSHLEKRIVHRDLRSLSGLEYDRLFLRAKDAIHAFQESGKVQL